MHRRRDSDRFRRRGALPLACALAAFGALVSISAPGSAQVVDSGTFDDSLQCVGVYVDGVDSNDSLNVREGPGVVYSVVLTLEPAAPAVATGLTSSVGNSTWYQIGIGDCEPVGWANASFFGLDQSAVPVPTTAVDDTGGGSDSTEPEVVVPSTADLDNSESSIQLSPFATALLALGVLGLLTGVTMFVRGRHSARDEGPPPGMVGPPGGPYFLARIDNRSSEPKTITVGGIPKPTPARRSDDLASEPIDEPLSAFPLLPDLASELEAEADKKPRPAIRLFDTKSFGAGNGAEEENGS